LQPEARAPERPPPPPPAKATTSSVCSDNVDRSQLKRSSSHQAPEWSVSQEDEVGDHVRQFAITTPAPQPLILSFPSAGSRRRGWRAEKVGGEEHQAWPHRRGAQHVRAGTCSTPLLASNAYTTFLRFWLLNLYEIAIAEEKGSDQREDARPARTHPQLQQGTVWPIDHSRNKDSNFSSLLNRDVQE
jgi:hypothetical protein